METYSVSQIAKMLDTQPETVRRWIRSGKLKAEQSSRKDGNIITENDLNKFLKASPKYAGKMAGAAVAVAGVMAAPIAALPLMGGIAAAYLTAGKKEKDSGFSKKDIKKYLQEEIQKRAVSISQKMKTIEQIQKEIVSEQQQIAEYNYVLEQLDEK